MQSAITRFSTKKKHIPTFLKSTNRPDLSSDGRGLQCRERRSFHKTSRQHHAQVSVRKFEASVDGVFTICFLQGLIKDNQGHFVF